jgi:SpoVK/Ycf46/Vps4 family AAA+-type ATPase
MEKDYLYDGYINLQWRRKLSFLISHGRKQEALKTLDRFVENVLPLFNMTPEIIEERRVAWLLRIELLTKWNRRIEALAWICLECELHPENKTAHILKDQLKYELDLVPTGEIRMEIKNTLVNVFSDWPGIAGMQELKTLLEIDVINPIRNPLIYSQYKVSIPNGILFYGPPGCGKTYVARRLAKKINYNFIEVTPSSTASIYVHGTQEKINLLFKEAHEKAPCVLFFDEFDAFAPNREDDNTSHHYRSEVNEFLTQLNECHERKILVIGATNNSKLIDPAVLRPGRLDIKIFIPPPDFEARVEGFKLYMKERPQDRIDWVRLAEYTDLYTFAEIKNIVDLAARDAANKRINISDDIIIDKILKNPATLTEEDLEKMRKWKTN